MLNFFNYVVTLGMTFWDAICFIADRVLSISTTTVSLTFSEFFNSISNSYFGSYGNPFKMYFTELGLPVNGYYDMITNLMGLINTASQTVIYLLNAFTSLFGVTLPINNTLITIVYFGVTFGSFLLILRLLSRFFRLVKDFINPTN